MLSLLVVCLILVLAVAVLGRVLKREPEAEKRRTHKPLSPTLSTLSNDNNTHGEFKFYVPARLKAGARRRQNSKPSATFYRSISGSVDDFNGCAEISPAVASVSSPLSSPPPPPQTSPPGPAAQVASAIMKKKEIVSRTVDKVIKKVESKKRELLTPGGAEIQRCTSDMTIGMPYPSDLDIASSGDKDSVLFKWSLVKLKGNNIKKHLHLPRVFHGSADYTRSAMSTTDRKLLPRLSADSRCGNMFFPHDVVTFSDPHSLSSALSTMLACAASSPLSSDPGPPCKDDSGNRSALSHPSVLTRTMSLRQVEGASTRGMAQSSSFDLPCHSPRRMHVRVCRAISCPELLLHQCEQGTSLVENTLFAFTNSMLGFDTDEEEDEDDAAIGSGGGSVDGDGDSERRARPMESRSLDMTFSDAGSDGSTGDTQPGHDRLQRNETHRSLPSRHKLSSLEQARRNIHRLFHKRKFSHKKKFSTSEPDCDPSSVPRSISTTGLSPLRAKRREPARKAMSSPHKNLMGLEPLQRPSRFSSCQDSVDRGPSPPPPTTSKRPTLINKAVKVFSQKAMTSGHSSAKESESSSTQILNSPLRKRSIFQKNPTCAVSVDCGALRDHSSTAADADGQLCDRPRSSSLGLPFSNGARGTQSLCKLEKQDTVHGNAAAISGGGASSCPMSPVLSMASPPEATCTAHSTQGRSDRPQLENDMLCDACRPRAMSVGRSPPPDSPFRERVVPLSKRKSKSIAKLFGLHRHNGVRTSNEASMDSLAASDSAPSSQDSSRSSSSSNVHEHPAAGSSVTTSSSNSGCTPPPGGLTSTPIRSNAHVCYSLEFDLAMPENAAQACDGCAGMDESCSDSSSVTEVERFAQRTEGSSSSTQRQDAEAAAFDILPGSCTPPPLCITDLDCSSCFCDDDSAISNDGAISSLSNEPVLANQESPMDGLMSSLEVSIVDSQLLTDADNTSGYNTGGSSIHRLGSDSQERLTRAHERPGDYASDTDGNDDGKQSIVQPSSGMPDQLQASSSADSVVADHLSIADASRPVLMSRSLDSVRAHADAGSGAPLPVVPAHVPTVPAEAEWDFGNGLDGVTFEVPHFMSVSRSDTAITSLKTKGDSSSENGLVTSTLASSNSTTIYPASDTSKSTRRKSSVGATWVNKNITKVGKKMKKVLAPIGSVDSGGPEQGKCSSISSSNSSSSLSGTSPTIEVTAGASPEPPHTEQQRTLSVDNLAEPARKKKARSPSPKRMVFSPLAKVMQKKDKAKDKEKEKGKKAGL